MSKVTILHSNVFRGVEDKNPSRLETSHLFPFSYDLIHSFAIFFFPVGFYTHTLLSGSFRTSVCYHHFCGKNTINTFKLMLSPAAPESLYGGGGGGGGRRGEAKGIKC